MHERGSFSWERISQPGLSSASAQSSITPLSPPRLPYFTMEVVVLGCGPSSSVPSMRCVLNQNCVVCLEAHTNPDSKNRRLNPSLLVRNLKTDTNVLVDCGKTFREAALRIFPKIGVSAVHSLVLTHDHADALLGMDDLREVQAHVETVDPVTKELYKIPPEAMKVHCSEPTSHEVIAKFPYLIDNEPAPPAGEAAPKPFRWTAKLQIDAFNPWEPFEASGIKFLRSRSFTAPGTRRSGSSLATKLAQDSSTSQM